MNITIKVHNLQNQTEAHKTHNHIYNDIKFNQKKKKEAVKLHVICVSSNNDRHCVTMTFIPLQYTSLHLLTFRYFPFKFHPSTLHYASPQLSTLHFFPFKFYFVTLHYTSPLHFFPFKFHLATLHYTSPHLSTLHFFPFKFYPVTLHYTSPLHFFPFKIHPNTLHYPLIWLNPISISYRFISPHFTTLHLTSLHIPSPNLQTCTAAYSAS